VVPRADLDTAAKKKPYPFHDWNPSHPAHSLVTVKLHISGSYFHNCMCALCNITEICYEALVMMAIQPKTEIYYFSIYLEYRKCNKKNINV
jgi:hypothetical protein